MRIITSPGCAVASPTRKTVFNLFVKRLLFIAVLLTTAVSLQAQTTRYVPSVYSTIQAAITAAAPGDIIQVEAGTLVLSSVVNVDKAVTIQGVSNTSTKIQVSGSGDRFDISASGVTIKNLEIEKTDKTGVQNIIVVRASNTTITNNKIHGQFVIGDGDVSRAMVFNAGAYSGIEISNNEFYNLRQPAYISGTHTGVITNNYTYNTKGWVLEGGNLTFTGNTWGVNVYDIAIIPSMPGTFYTDIVAVSNANNGAVIEDQRVSPAVLSVVYVDASTSFSTDLGGKYHPYSAITPAITRAVAGGTIKVAAGTYAENITVNKSLTIKGANADISCSGTRSAESVISAASGVAVTISADNVTLNGFEITAPNSLNAVSCGTVSALTIKNNNIHHVGSALTGEHPSGVFGIIYTVPDAINKQDVLITDNCINNIGSSTIIKKSPAAIGILQSTSTGTLTGLNIERNTISNVNVFTGDWTTAGGRIAYGIQINTGGSSSYLTTGKVVNAIINNNTITNLTGFIATGIALEGNTENAVVDGNTVSNLTGYKLANRAGGGYDLQALKFENNRYVSTVTVQNNSFNANTFNYGATPNNKGYAVANYVPVANGGIASLGCNWYGTANYGELVAEYTAFTGKIFNKDGAGTDFVSYSTAATPVNCSGVNAQPANLTLTYEHTSENVIVNFDVAGNASAIYPIPGLNPSVPADLTAITAKYAALQTAIAGGNAAAIKAAALEIGDDILTEYYYMDGTTKVYLKTAGGNNLIKNKYWDKYLNNTSTGVRYPSFADNRFIVPVGTYSTSTNPNTGGAVNTGWLSAVYGKTLYVTVTFLHNGEVFTATQSVAIPAAPVVNTNTGLGYLKIQTAINDPLTENGHTITVAAGTYAENVVVNKELTINGPQSGNNVSSRYTAFVNGVNGPKADPAVEAIITAPVNNPTGTNPGANDLIRVLANNVTINGFVIDGNNPAISGTSAIQSGTVDIDARRGIINRSTNDVITPVNNLNVKYNIIQNLAERGLNLYNGTSTSSTGNIISENLFRSYGAVADGGQAIILYTNAYADITNNTIDVPTNNIGLHLQNFYSNGSMNWTGNVVSVGQDGLGIHANLFYAPSATLTIANNTVNAATGVTGTSGFTWGINVWSVQSGSTVTVNNNTVGTTGGEFSRGINLWNLPTSNAINVSGGSVGNSIVGINLDNVDPYYGGGSNTVVNVSNIIVNANQIGIQARAATLETPPIYAPNTVTGSVNMNMSGIIVSVPSTALAAIAVKAPLTFTGSIDLSNSTLTGGQKGISVDGDNASANIHDNPSTITGAAVGIDVTNGASATVFRNSIVSNGIGIRAATGGKLTSVTENFITNNTTDGIKLESDAGTVGNVETNDLSGNTGKAINNLATATFDATCNWFGTVDATAIAAKVSGLPVANYTPYLTNGTDANPGTAGFQNTSCRTVYHADPMLIDVVITSQSPCPQIDPNKLPLNSYSTVKVNLVNLDEFNAIPGGTTTLSVQLGSNFDLKPGFVIANAGLNNYFDWTYNSSTHTITGVQKVNVSIPEDFIGYTEFEVQATPSGTNTVVAEFQVTNHGPDNFLVDDNTGNNEVETNYTVLSALTISLSGSTNVSCNGGANGSITVTGSGGATPYKFSIDNGNTWLPAGGTSSAYTFNNLLPGTYTVIIRDFVCVETTLTPDVNISQPAAITALSGPSHIATSVSCNGGSNGAVNLSFTATGGTGTLAYAYAWTKQGGGFSASTEDISNLTAGVYDVTITVTDANNCVQTFTHSATVTEPSILVAAINGTPVTCFGGSNGTVTASATGGTPNYSYAWGNGPSTPGQTGLAAGTYTVTITDANGCQDTETFVVNQPSDITLTANTSVVNISCNGQATGTINLTATAGGGTPGYTYAYSWTASNGGTVPAGQVNAEDLSGLTPGTYTVTVTVTDNNNCAKQFVAAASAVISQAAAITVQSGPSFNITQVKCKGGNNGIIDLSFIAQGGTGALSYSYLWTKVGDPQFSSTSDDLNNLTAGTYNVVITVTDDNNCTATFNGQAIVTEPANALIMNSSVSTIACAGTQGSVTVTAFGGTAPYQFSNDNGNSWQAPAGNTYTFNMPAGPYTILVKDANDCQNSISGTLTQPANTDISIGSSANGTLFSGSVTELSIIFNLSEIAGKNATPVTLRIFKPSGYDIVFDNTLTSVPGPIPPATISVDNTKWQLTTSNGIYYDFTRTAAGGNNTILCSQTVRVVFKLRRNTTSTGSFNLGTQFRAATGELITVNNNNTLLFTAQ